MKRVAWNIPNDLVRSIEKLARPIGATQSSVVAEVLRAWVKRGCPLASSRQRAKLIAEAGKLAKSRAKILERWKAWRINAWNHGTDMGAADRGFAEVLKGEGKRVSVRTLQLWRTRFTDLGEAGLCDGRKLRTGLRADKSGVRSTIEGRSKGG